MSLRFSIGVQSAHKLCNSYAKEGVLEDNIGHPAPSSIWHGERVVPILDAHVHIAPPEYCR